MLLSHSDAPGGKLYIAFGQALLLLRKFKFLESNNAKEPYGAFTCFFI